MFCIFYKTYNHKSIEAFGILCFICESIGPIDNGPVEGSPNALTCPCVLLIEGTEYHHNVSISHVSN